MAVKRSWQRFAIPLTIIFMILMLWSVFPSRTEAKAFESCETPLSEKKEKKEPKLPIYEHLSDAKVTLRNGHTMPLIGFGTAGLSNTLAAVDVAIDAGFRLIDTAAEEAVWYRNEAQIGHYLSTSPIRREQIFLTTKLHPNQLGFSSTQQAILKSLENLKTSYIDLYLIHYPFCWGDICNQQPQGTWEESWRAMEEGVHLGRIRAIGVSNFHLSDLERLMEVAQIKPDVLQNWFDPMKQHRALRRFCEHHGIVFQAYSLLGTQHLAQGHAINPVLEDETVKAIAEKYQKSPANVIIRWALQLGIPVLPRSNNPLHIRENIQLDDYHLTEEEMEAMDQIDSRKR